jgi:FkbM family methyltransferase
MHLIKKFLSKILSESAYLKTLHRVFFLLYSSGLLKGNPNFKYHYMVRKLIQPNFVVLDIGANLGYFARTFSNLAKQGKVIAIEPVPAFYQVLKHFLGKRANIEIHNVALGREEGTVTMVMPQTDGFIRTGLPHIYERENENENENERENETKRTQEVRIVKALTFLEKFGKIDYIKCDIEGYEGVVFKEIQPLIEKYRPFVQLEIDQKNRVELLRMFQEMNYLHFGIENQTFVAEHEDGDYFFVPQEKTAEFQSWVA